MIIDEVQLAQPKQENAGINCMPEPSNNPQGEDTRSIQSEVSYSTICNRSSMTSEDVPRHFTEVSPEQNSEDPAQVQLPEMENLERLREQLIERLGAAETLDEILKILEDLLNIHNLIETQRVGAPVFRRSSAQGESVRHPRSQRRLVPPHSAERGNSAGGSASPTGRGLNPLVPGESSALSIESEMRLQEIRQELEDDLRLFLKIEKALDNLERFFKTDWLEAGIGLRGREVASRILSELTYKNKARLDNLKHLEQKGSRQQTPLIRIESIVDMRAQCTELAAKLDIQAQRVQIARPAQAARPTEAVRDRLRMDPPRLSPGVSISVR